MNAETLIFFTAHDEFCIQNQAFSHKRNDTIKIHALRMHSGLPQQAFIGVFKKM
jgi:hypothetical protein